MGEGEVPRVGVGEPQEGLAHRAASPLPVLGLQVADGQQEPLVGPALPPVVEQVAEGHVDLLVEDHAHILGPKQCRRVGGGAGLGAQSRTETEGQQTYSHPS